MNFLYFWLGFFVLLVNKIRYTFLGYRKPRDFSISETDKAIAYDFGVVDSLLNCLEKYSGIRDVSEKNILELGPGADLGLGLILLSMGAKKYNSLDVNNLVKSVPDIFYNNLFKKIADKNKINDLQIELQKLKNNQESKLNYVVDKKFDFSVFKGIDLVLSQAAFEHFDNISKTIKRMSRVMKKGAVLVAEIDLRTHTGCLINRDPLSIYRYPNIIYNLLKFKGAPNRVRPFAYKEALEKNGFANIEIYPVQTLKEQEYKKVKNFLSGKYKAEKNQMQYLTFMLCATKK